MDFIEKQEHLQIKSHYDMMKKLKSLKTKQENN